MQSSSWHVARRKNKFTQAQKLLTSTSTVFLKFSSVCFLEPPSLITPRNLCQDLHVKEKINNWIIPLFSHERKTGTSQINLTGEVYGWQISITTQMKRPIWILTRMEKSGFHFRKVWVSSGLCSQFLDSPGIVSDFLVILLKCKYCNTFHQKTVFKTNSVLVVIGGQDGMVLKSET